MKKTQTNLSLLFTFYAVSVVVANLMCSTGAMIDLFKIGDFPITATSAVLTYSVSYLATDVISQIWGKRQAQTAVYIGIFANVLSMVLLFGTKLLFSSIMSYTDVYDVLTNSALFTLSGIVAFICSQSWDVFAFHKIKGLAEKVLGEERANRHRWIWNNGSTMTSQFIDSIVCTFLGVVVFKLLPVSGVAGFFGLFIGEYLVKWAIALLDTPVFYLLTRKEG